MQEAEDPLLLPTADITLNRPGTSAPFHGRSGAGANATGSFEPLSFDLPVGLEGEATLGDLLDLEDERLDPIHEVEFMLLQEHLHAVLDTLSEREFGVLSMRYGLTDGEEMTLDQIGKVYGITRERIRQIESKTISKLRHPSRRDVLEPYLYGGGRRPTEPWEDGETEP